MDLNIGNLKFTDSDIERAIEKAIGNLNKLEQEALQAMIATKKAADEAQSKALQSAMKTTQAQKKQIDELIRGLDIYQNKAAQTVSKSSSLFAGLGSSLKKSLNIVGQLTGIGTLISLVVSAGRKVKEFVGEFAKTKEGAKQLEGINLQWAKMKAVASDFLKSSLEKIIPIFDKVLPYIQKGFQVVTAVVAGAVAGYKAYLTNLVSEFKVVGNNFQIAYLSLKAFFTGSDEAKDKITELRAANVALKASHIDVGAAAKNAYEIQLVAAGKAADGAKVSTEATKEQIAAFKKLREEYAKLLKEFDKDVDAAKFDAIASPFKKLEVTREKALAEIDKLRTEIVDKAKKSKQQLPLEFEANITILKAQAESQYRTELSELLKSLRKINVIDLANDNLSDTIAESLKGAFKIPQSVFDEAKKAGIEISKIAGYLFLDPTSQSVLDEGLAKNESDLKDKMLKHVLRSQQLTEAIIKKRPKAKDNQNFIAGLLGISDSDFSQVSDALNQGLNAAFQAAQENVNGQIEANNRLIESIRARVSAAQQGLNQELEAQRNGSANNVATRQKELDALKRQETEALRAAEDLQKKKVRQQLAQDALAQASNLITTGTNLFASETLGKGVAGLIFAALAIPTMLALFARLKNSAKGAATNPDRAYEGGDLGRDYGLVGANGNGHTDQNGGRGHKVEGTNLIIGGDEYLNKASVARKHRTFLDRLNSGEFDGINIAEVLDKPRQHLQFGTLEAANTAWKANTKSYASDLESEVKDLRRLIKKDQINQAASKADQQEMFDRHSKEMQRISDEKEVYIPIVKDQIGYIKVSKGKREKIMF